MNSVPDKFLKPYNAKEVESKIYKKWEDSGYFNPDNLPKRHKKPFSIALPPPNVTGTLHIGHATMLVIQDIVSRFQRMSGKKVLWIPGTDHAAIATQSKVEEILYKKENKTRYDFGREELLKKIEQFAKESHDVIVSQVKRVGSSLDWSREAYTLDEKRNLAVNTAFKKMYDDGLIYRGKRIVNWDPKMQTTVSDDEIEYKEETTSFYYLKYGPFVIGTARPETKFGDKYVVMHPKDKRYEKYLDGQKLELEWINGPITATIVKDEVIDMEFGTGVMTITPAHSAVDFEIAKRHNLDIEQIINERGLLLPIAGSLAGQHIKKARPLIVSKLEEKGLVEKIDEKYIHNIATNSRGGGTIEPQIKLQWFVSVNKEFKIPHSEIPDIKSGSTTTLKKMMKISVEGGAIKIIPNRFEKVYYHWIDNLRDWCISRQIWYGHRIPVWYCTFSKDGKSAPLCANPIVGIEIPDSCPHCGGTIEQDEDTLDTWFSSGLWTFSTLGWPKENPDLKKYHPTSIMETGYDILFFWVARMILMSGYLLGDIPFKTVYLHGLVRDAKGQKMSKSLGNIIDPVDMIDKYGADALRLALIIGTGPGNDSKMSEDKIRAHKLFANKLWNISRFVLENTNDFNGKIPRAIKELGELEEVTRNVTSDLEKYKFYLAGEKLYHYIWHTFADKIIEESKKSLNSTDKKIKEGAQEKLLFILNRVLILLHPFMPFITEEIWQSLLNKKTLLMIENWPVLGNNK